MDYNYINDEYIRDYYMRAVIIIALNNRVNKEKREKKRNNFKLDTRVTWNGILFLSMNVHVMKKSEEYNNACKTSQFLKNVSNTFSRPQRDVQRESD